MLRIGLCIFVVSTICGCAAGKLMPESERNFKYQVDTTASKTDAFNKTLSFAASRIGDSNEAIKLKDKESGHLVMKTNLICNELRQSGDINDYSLSFVFDVQLEDQSAEMEFGNLVMVDEYGRPVGWGYNQLVSKENLKKVEPCILSLKNALVAAINEAD